MSAKRSVEVWSGAKNREMRGSFFLPREPQGTPEELIEILGQLGEFDEALKMGGCRCKRCREWRKS